MKKSLVSALSITLLAVALSACGSSGNSTSNSAGNPAGSTDNSASASATDSGSAQPATGGGKKKIAVLLYSRGFEFMVALDQGIQQKAAELGVEVTVLDGQSNSQTQIGQIEDNIAKKVDAIVLAPNNSDELVPGVKKANQAGIPVVTVDSVVSQGADVVSSVTFDNKKAGKMAAEYIIKQLQKGTVLENTGAQGAYHAVLRGGGFNEGMKATPDFKVISKNADWQAENAQNITADSVTANPDINAIFSHNDDMIRGILGGLRQIGKLKNVGEAGHIMIVGTDGTPEALERIRKGQQDATVQQDPFEMGAAAVQAAVDKIDGKEVTKEQYMPATLVTKDNVDDPNLWGNKFKK